MLLDGEAKVLVAGLEEGVAPVWLIAEGKHGTLLATKVRISKKADDVVRMTDQRMEFKGHSTIEDGGGLENEFGAVCWEGRDGGKTPGGGMIGEKMGKGYWFFFFNSFSSCSLVFFF